MLKSESLSLYQLLSQYGYQLLDEQRDNGSFPPSQNGEVDEQLTPVRNTANCLKILLFSYEQTADDRFIDALNDSVDFLHSETARPHGYTFHDREVEGKDGCNGLMGQCKPLIALSLADEFLDGDRHQDLAREVFLLHPYDEATGLWRCVEIDGTVLPFDRTFNHQLWFAAAGAHFRSIPEIDERVRGFLDALGTNMRTDDGLIAHRLRPKFSCSEYLRYLRDPLRRPLVRNQLLHYLRPPGSRERLRRKAIRYQSINLFALSFLKRAYPDHDVWQTSKVESAIDYIHTEQYKRRMREEGFVNKPTGLQNAVALHAFEPENAEERRWWVREQLRRSYDPDTGRLGRSAIDPTLMATSIYMARYLPDMEFTLDDVAAE